MLYKSLTGYSNVIACSYSGNNFGVDLAFRNDLKKYLLSNNAKVAECLNSSICSLIFVS